jgi:curved DNA-binding protein CbpA
MASNADPYRTLGLDRGASVDDVKRAYRRLAKANHPDAAGPGALPRFLAIQAAYEQLVGPDTGRGGPQPARRGSAADADRSDATRRAYGGGRTARPGARSRPAPGPRPGPQRPGPASPGSASSGATGSGPAPRAGRGKATLGSTSYDGADAGPFEPDWGGASWYGTTSGTYWTINPKEYADPRKHGPEYQARARRAAGAKAGEPAGADPSPRSGAPTHTTSSWWDSTSGPAPDAPAEDDGDEPPAGTAAPSDPDWATGPFEPPREAHASTREAERHARTASEPAPDPASAAMDLGRALTDPHSGGLRGRVLRAVLGWLPIALGLGWLIGELTGCGRFAATCDPSVTPLVAAGQAFALVGLLLLPEVAAIAAGAALVLLAAAIAASLILSATGAAADEGSRRAALSALLVVAWVTGLAIALVRRVRSGSRSARPVS